MSRWVVLILAFPALAVLKGLHAAAADHNPSSEGICEHNTQNSSNDIASDDSALLQSMGRNSIDYLDHGFAEARRRVEDLKHRVQPADYPNFPYLVKIVRDGLLQSKVRCQGSIISNGKNLGGRTWVVTTAACFRDGINFQQDPGNPVVWRADLPRGWRDPKFYIKRYAGPGGQATTLNADRAYSFRPAQNPELWNADIVLLTAPGFLSAGVPISRNDLTKNGEYDFSAWKLEGTFTKSAFIESWKLRGAADQANYLTDLSAEENVDLSCQKDSLDDTGSPGVREHDLAGDPDNINSYDKVELHFVYYYTACSPNAPKQKKFVAIAIQKVLVEICAVCNDCNTACTMLDEAEEQSDLSFSVESGNDGFLPITRLNPMPRLSRNSMSGLTYSQRDVQDMLRSNDERPDVED